MSRILLTVATLGLAYSPATASASELFTGLFVHDVDTPLTQGGLEDGADLQLGWRGGRLGFLSPIGSPSPYLFGSLAVGSETHFIAGGLSWRIGGRLFVRPGLGFAIHTRSSSGIAPNGLRTDLGSRVLIEPELGVGYQVSERVAVEAAWVHISQGQLLSRQNPGMDSIGVRLSYRLP